MRPVLEMQNLEIETLCELRNGYKYGDFERFAKFLTFIGPALLRRTTGMNSDHRNMKA